ncbi:spondin domain-containing protein [Haloarcula litorea]|uniref:spondin domain-containing protein n=1 Tax=Haloarcula litorea TaxID=3032579 RepID=UPI0023E88C7D|nr:spondin domain-containing protein [Halomicroarcula sp. GDY20]
MSDRRTRRQFLTGAGSVAVASLAGCGGSDGGSGGGTDTTESEMTGSMTETPTDESMTEATMGQTTFEVVVENVSDGETLSTSMGSVAVPLSPGAYAVHTADVSLFTPMEPASDGLEAVAEDGTPTELAQSLGGMDPVLDGGAFTTPDGADGPAPLTPGDSYSFEVTAGPDADARLSLATMFVQSNDLFYAPPSDGIPLFDDGDPVDRDVTGDLRLWDAGTEVNEPPGEGPNQAPRQSGPDTGTPEGVVREVTDGYDYPDTADVVSLSLSVVERGMEAVTFAATVENASDGETLSTSMGSTAVPLSPGAYAVHTPDVSLFTAGEPASDGLEDIAEDGTPTALARSLGGMDPVLDGGAFTTPQMADGPAPIGPGDRYRFEFTADRDADARLSLATMFVQSNDLFYAPPSDGIPLFDDGDPVEGELTDALRLWDAGTEVNEPPGEGPNQAPRQSGPDTGTPEGVVREVTDGYDYPDTDEVIAVSVTPR